MQFTTTGPYQFVRNPLYIGNILIYLGATVTSELAWMVPLTLFWSGGIYSFVVWYEEGHLLEQYGEGYGAFLQEVPRWIPRTLTGKHLGLVSEHLRRAVRAEVHCLLILVPFVLKEVVHGTSSLDSP